jgi:hypothetical protein
MPVDNKTRKQNRLRQYNEILLNGLVTDHPCELCLSQNKECVMDLKSRNCAECTRRGRKCTKRFHSDREWDRLERDRQRLADELKDAKKRWLEYSQKMQNEMSTILRLETQQEFLRQRNDNMRYHDSAVLDQLDSDNPLSAEDLAELDRLADASDAQVLAATSENPTLTQMIASADPNSPFSWSEMDAFLLGNAAKSPSPAGGTVEPAGGSPSNSR